jgi:hypothetical protein
LQWMYVSPAIDWLKQGVGQFALRSINLVILFGIRRYCLRSGRSLSLFLFIKRVIKKNCSNCRGITLLSSTYKILSNILLSRFSPHAEEINGHHHCGCCSDMLLLFIFSKCKYNTASLVAVSCMKCGLFQETL